MDASDDSDAAAGILARLADEAELVDDGAFSLDPAAARAKLADRQLADPDAWVLLVIEAAELANARRVDIRERVRGLRVTLEGPGVAELAPPSELPELFSWVFTRVAGLDEDARRVTRARQLLALAINATTARHGHWLALTVTTPERGLKLSIKRDEPLRLSEASAGAERIELWSYDTDTRPFTVRRECRLVVGRCGYGQVPIHVAGYRVTPQPRVGPRKDERVLELDGRRIGRVGLLHELVEPQLSIVANGVEVETIVLGGLNWGFFAVVSDALERDLSLGNVIRDQRFEATIVAVRAAHDQLIERQRSLGGETRALARRGGDANPGDALVLADDPRPLARLKASVALASTMILWPLVILTAVSSMWAATAVLGALWTASGLATIRHLRLRQLFGLDAP